MADEIQRAPTGRAKCRGCGRSIPKGELRFGAHFANPYGEGEAVSWFHLPCAAMMMPDGLPPAMESTTETLPEEPWLRRTALAGTAHPRLRRLVGVERASSGRAQCRHCKEPIGKGTLRLRVQMFDEGRVVPLGTLHVGCAAAYLGTADILDRIGRLSPEASANDLSELALSLGAAPVALPSLAKTEPGAEPAERRSG